MRSLFEVSAPGKLWPAAGYRTIQLKMWMITDRFLVTFFFFFFLVLARPGDHRSTPWRTPALPPFARRFDKRRGSQGYSGFSGAASLPGLDVVFRAGVATRVDSGPTGAKISQMLAFLPAAPKQYHRLGGVEPHKRTAWLQLLRADLQHRWILTHVPDSDDVLAATPFCHGDAYLRRSSVNTYDTRQLLLSAAVRQPPTAMSLLDPSRPPASGGLRIEGCARLSVDGRNPRSLSRGWGHVAVLLLQKKFIDPLLIRSDHHHLDEESGDIGGRSREVPGTRPPTSSSEVTLTARGSPPPSIKWISIFPTRSYLLSPASVPVITEAARSSGAGSRPRAWSDPRGLWRS
ncbi:hypothetical protein B0T13DRAFT_525219 [Neurospora crassa]|nr:hypothetical protein B0T13DRAFT_525219 [Neurospora crassa]